MGTIHIMEPGDHVTETSKLTGKPGGPILQKERIEPSPSSSKPVISDKNACMSEEPKKTLIGLVIVALLTCDLVIFLEAVV